MNTETKEKLMPFYDEASERYDLDAIHEFELGRKMTFAEKLDFHSVFMFGEDISELSELVQAAITYHIENANKKEADLQAQAQEILKVDENDRTWSQWKTLEKAGLYRIDWRDGRCEQCPDEPVFVKVQPRPYAYNDETEESLSRRGL